MGGDPVPGLHVALREWFEAFKAREIVRLRRIRHQKV